MPRVGQRHHLLVCDRDGGAITELNIQTDERRVLLNGLDRPHGLVLLDGAAVVSEAGKLTSYLIAESGVYVEPRILVEGIPVGNHQTNTVDVMPNGTLLWHSGSTCNVCDEADERNAALLWVNAPPVSTAFLQAGFAIPSMAYGWKATAISSPTTVETGGRSSR